jgi:hypothetical protein
MQDAFLRVGLLAPPCTAPNKAASNPSTCQLWESLCN